MALAIQTPRGRQTGPPNVVFFFTDQQRWDSTGVAGNPLGLTPTFDRLAAEGTYVANAFTPQPVCGPARACLQSGRYATATGCVTNGIAMPTNCDTLATQFRTAGYKTGYIGKWHLAGKGNGPGAVPVRLRGGYEYWLAADALEHTSDAYTTTVWDNENQPVQLSGYRVDALTDAGIRYIDRHQAHPFFLFLSFLEPHQQNHRDEFAAPRGYAQRYTDRFTPPDLASLVGNAPQSLGGYWGMAKRLDEALGRVVDALISLDLLDNTIVVFTSDHGCHFKTRNAAYKRTCHESSIRVPLALHGPGFMGGGRLKQLVSLLDLPPTLADAAGLQVPESWQGRSLMPLLRRESSSWQDDVLIQISESGMSRAIRTSRWKYCCAAPDRKGSDVFADTYVDAFLYDLLADPYELTNLVALPAYDEVLAKLRSRLLARMTAAGEPAPAILPASRAAGSGARQVLPGEAEL